MSVLKSSLAAFSVQAVKILNGLFIIKLISYMLGPAGMAFIGNYMSVINMTNIIAGGGISNGIIKYIAENESDKESQIRVISTSICYSSVFSLVIFLGSILFSEYISNLIFSSVEYKWIIISLGVSQAILAFINIVNSVFNGQRDTVSFAKISIIGFMSSFPFVYCLISTKEIEFVALSLLLPSLLCFFPAVYYWIKSPFSSLVTFKFDIEQAKKLAAFSIMLFVSMSTFPVTEILVRSELIQVVGETSTGYWQALIKLSAVYLSIAGVFLANYYMPLISSISDRKKIFRLVLSYLFALLVIFSLGASIYYLLREQIVVLVFSDEFLPMTEFIQYQLLGDFLKLSCMIIGFVGVAKAATKLYIAAEVFQCATFLFLTHYFLDKFAEITSVYKAYIFTYSSYLIICIICLMVYTYRGKNVNNR